MIFLVQAKTRTVYSPGDDDMDGPFYENIFRIVEADDIESAQAKFLKTIERHISYEISVACEAIQIHEMIR